MQVWHRRPDCRRHVWRITAFALAGSLELGGCASSSEPPTVAQERAPISSSPLGSYLAGRQAERGRDYDNAARYITNVLASEPENFEILSRAHLLLLVDGRFDDAA